ncbi:MAG TPA: TetR/AcrR family transcriptional regulator [Syntrophomonadaceae bacterium]|nr:TetR/AcrR family transcriptional regulator [Syntrophomonadaceae bacterium]
MDIPSKILAASRELINDKGLVNWTVDDLAQKAKVSKRTIYRYFSSKDEIIEITLENFMLEIQAKFKNIVTQKSAPTEILSALILEIYKNTPFIVNNKSLNDLKDSYPHLWQKIDSFRSARLTEFMKHLMALDNAEFLQEIDERIFTTVVITIIQSVLNPTFLLENDLPFNKVIGDIGRLLEKILA